MEPIFIGQIMLWPADRTPAGFMPCNGATLNISTYTLLYSIIGNTYGGGTTTFCLPNLQGITLAGVNSQTNTLPAFSQLNTVTGSEMETLATYQLPGHIHLATVSKTAVSAEIIASLSPASSAIPDGLIPAAGTSDSGDDLEIDLYTQKNDATATALPNALRLHVSPALSEISLDAAGDGAAHDNRQPYLSMNYIIAVEGTYPSLT